MLATLIESLIVGRHYYSIIKYISFVASATSRIQTKYQARIRKSPCDVTSLFDHINQYSYIGVEPEWQKVNPCVIKAEA